uniref:RING-type E3 ubiquitin transferase n=1 Tax=Oryza glumipatula TaxID=40148 RepID=A0A0D9ZUD4_9ORYZ
MPPPPPPPPPPRPFSRKPSEPAAPSTRAVVAVAGVTVEDADALECGVCFLPLRPPIFQCEVGHVVCSPCRDKLAPAGRCHVCRVAVAGGEYRRCYALERLVDAIRVACPHAAHGCGATPAYHALDAHRRACPHAPCHCPGERCGFVGSTAALVDHFAAAHRWPCAWASEAVSVLLRDGLNFLRVVDLRRPGDASHHRLVMLNVTREALGRAISVLCIHPLAAAAAAAKTMQCELELFVPLNGDDGVDGGQLRRRHYQKSEFPLGCGDLADHKTTFKFVVPRCVVGDDDEGGIRIRDKVSESWPCTTNVRAGETVSVHLRDGLAFLRVHHHRRGGSATYSDHLIMLNVTREPYGRVVSVLCIRPHAAAEHQVSSPPPPAMQCELLLVSRFGYDGDGGHCRSHYQKSEFLIGCSDLADGLPDREQNFQFMVPRCVVGDDDEGGIQIHRIRHDPKLTERKQWKQPTTLQRKMQRSMASSSHPSRRAMSEEEEDDNGGGEEEESQRETAVVEEEEEESTGVHVGEAEMAASEEQAPPSSSRRAFVTVADADALECGVCRLPLRPPVFQCEDGHVVCSPCRDKLAAAAAVRCHVCGGGGYRRCHAFERLVDAIRVACPHAAHGCAARVAYHGLDAHRRACPHAPCHCPGERCGFVGSTAALVDHFAAAHRWPCAWASEAVSVLLRDGLNFLRVVDLRRPGDASHHRLVMLNVTREALGRAISVLCIHPLAAAAAAAKTMQCELELFVPLNGDDGVDGGQLRRRHYQKSEFPLGCGDLADHKTTFKFVVPRCVVGDDDEGGIRIRDKVSESRRVMAALDHEGDTMARKKRRVYVAIEEIESHGHEEDDDGGEEVEEEDEQSHGEADGDGDDAAAAMEESDGHDEEGDNGGDEPDQSPDGDDMEEEEERGGGGGGGVHGGEAEVETFRHSEQASSARPVVAVAGVTVEDADALECGVCCLPLRPPIFQCEVGHVVCAPCRDKLAPAGRCHVCRAAVAGGEYRRCHALERLVDAIRVACPHAAHGCAARPAYHDVEAHRLACPHGPCHCPGERCGFVGSTAALVDHFAAAHRWPCAWASEAVSVLLRDGLNFLRVVDLRRPGDASHHRLVMLNVTREALGRAISVLCIHPLAAAAAAAKTMQCELELFVPLNGDDGVDGGQLRRRHYQKSEFPLGCGDLADHKTTFKFVVPRCVVGDDDEGGIRIRPLGRAISVLCIHPHAAPAAEMQCELRLHVSRPADDAGGGLCISHYQKSVFHIGYSDLADGVPDRRRRFQFVVPRHVVGGDNEDGVQIRVRIKY